MYKILIKYTTGNSFTSNEEEDCIEMEFKDLKTVKENMERIKEHYHFNTKLSYGFYKGKHENFIKQYNNKDWFVENMYSSIKLYTDDGKHFQTGCFWIGHFENLISISIVLTALYNTTIYLN